MKKGLVLLAFCALANAAFAGGETGADVLKARPSARAAAMGEAYAALGDDLGVMAYNPAGLALIKGPSLSFLHFAQVAGVSTENISYAHPLSFGTLGVGLLFRNQPDIANPLATDAPVSAWDLVLGASYAGRPGKWLTELPERLAVADFGLNIKYVRSHLSRFDADTFAIDAGLRAELGEGLIGGVSVLNMGPPIKFIDVADPLPATLLLGVSRAFDPIAGNRISLAVDMETPLQGALRLHFGAEDWLGDSFALRAGYLLDNGESLNGFTAGFGVRLIQEGLVFNLDYALRPYYYAGFSSYDAQHLFQITLVF